VKNLKSLVVACALSGLAIGCTNPPANTCTVEPPATWEAPDWDANTAEALALRAQLDVLIADTMRAAEQGEVTVDGVDDLTGPYAAGNPSIESITTPFYAGIVGDVFSEFLEITAAGPVDLVDDEGAWSPGDAGGIFGMSNRGINEGGLEVRQLADKGLFAGAALYNHALTLTEGDITPATIEALAALWGANPTLDAAGELTDSANYSHSMGYHAEIRSSLIAARAYAADEACGAERDEAVVAFFRAWEQSMFARFVYYANAGASELGAAASDDDVAGGLHELAEGVGLALGFRGVPHPASGPLSGAGRVVTDAQIDEMMSAVGVNVDDLGASTTGEFVTDPAPFAEGVLEVEGIAAEAFDLQSAEVEAWRNPTEG
jgi:hypothetical protein